jgi:hypothetical protein
MDSLIGKTDRSAYRRMTSVSLEPGDSTFVSSGAEQRQPRDPYGGGLLSGAPYEDESGGAGGIIGNKRWRRPFSGAANFQIGCAEILQFIQVALLAVVVIVILIVVFEISSHRSTVYHLATRVESVENLARNVNDFSKVMRRAIGERGLDESEEENRDRNRDKSSSSGGWHDWLKDRGPEEEGLITDNAIQTIVRGVRAAIRLSEQMDRARLFEVVSQLGDHVDQIITGPETVHILQAVDATVTHPQAQNVAAQTLDFVAHLEGGLLPVMDALVVELRQQLAALSASDPEHPFLSREQLRAMLKEIGDVTHKVGTGMRDLVVWYRSGGPAEASALAAQLVHTTKELLESPAAASLVQVMEGIDWHVTGQHMADVGHNAAAILRAINQAGTVQSGDHLIRAFAGILDDPGTKRVMALMPGILANATALLAKPNAQRLIEHGSALMARVDSVLDEAETARTVEKTADFLTTLRNLLGILIEGGMHLKIGDPDTDDVGQHSYLERSSEPGRETKPLPSRPVSTLLHGLPRVVDYEPDQRPATPQQPQHQHQPQPPHRRHHRHRPPKASHT